ncbi:hypothetical protein A1OO_08555 [Enterovibrio norvegicus FF-33]|uniref:phage tail tip fiber protein n=1 Tax=Enterovibrio norvegicus TaxID=188144 RepID=UPI0002EC389A|nr:DUF1983 domain-containing protein [Enterovibrio norvegicus]OEE65849.1 hypothetical protein A1OO_08555 [Enterovibrio norvegicus FF-33]
MTSKWNGRRDLDALIENVEKLTGRRGNGLHRALTLQDLADLNIIGIRRSSVSGGSKLIPIPPPSKPGNTTSTVERPTLPQGMQGYGGFGAILIRWNVPDYAGHSHTEIWKASPDEEGNAPSLSDAVMIGTTRATLFSDVVSTGATFYFWLRHVNVKDIPGPYTDEGGLYVETSVDISRVIDEIGEQLEDSELIAFLRQDIAQTGETFDNMWGVKQQAGDIQAGIGLLAKEDGTSQVAIAASSVVIFDPNQDTEEGQPTLSPLFAIDDGNVVIPRALIRKATIQILDAQIITADKVVSGISMESPVITGGTFYGGDAFFGVGGPYGGYHTHITNDGRVYTDDLYASGYIFGSEIHGTSVYSSAVHSTSITGGSIYGARITTIQNYYACLGDNHSARAYPWNGGLSVACLPRFNGHNEVGAGHNDSGWKSLTSNLYSAGDLTTPTHVDEVRRFRFRTIAPGAFRIKMCAPRAGGTRFGGFRLALMNSYGHIVATSDSFTSALGHSRALRAGDTFTCGQMTFVVETAIYNASSEYAQQMGMAYRGSGGMYCVFRNAKTLYGVGWTTNPSSTHRLAIRQESAHDYGGFKTIIDWDVNNAIDPR